MVKTSYSNYGGIRRVAIASLVWDQWPRSAGFDESHLQRLMEAPWPLPPILVHASTMCIIDGFHRVAVAMHKGIKELEAYLVDGPPEAVFVVAVEANVTHGLPLPLEDRRLAAQRILRSHPQWSDRVIATRAGLSAKTVAQLRRATADALQLDNRIGRDGRVRPRNTASGRRRAAALIAERPGASLREIAKAAGISTGTVRDVRARVGRGEDPVPSRVSANHATPRTRRRSALNAVDAVHTPDVTQLLSTLSRDPSLRLNAAGRELLRWLHTHVIQTSDGIKVMETAPDHCIDQLAGLARSCAVTWNRVAEQLSRRSSGLQNTHAEQPAAHPDLHREKCS